MAEFPKQVKIVEVGPRDGLQNEAARIWTATKIELIDRLSATGLKAIETTSFVSPKWIPQLADAEDVYAGITRAPGVSYPALVPNMTGMERALAAGAEEIALFSAASETFNKRNINASIAESIARFEPVMERARAENIRVRMQGETRAARKHALQPAAVIIMAVAQNNGVDPVQIDAQHPGVMGDGKVLPGVE